MHRDGILAVTRVPAQAVDDARRAEAVALAERIAAAIDYVGVLCVEFFVLDDGALVANEMAPRPHNSGHYSIDACDVSQFELQVRAMTGAPLVAPRLHSPALMLNLLGDLWFRGGAPAAVEPPWDRVLALPGAHLHLYGKRERAARPQDGPPDPDRGQRRGRRRRGPRGRGDASASPAGERRDAGRRSSMPPPWPMPRRGSPPASWSPFRPRPSTASAPAPTTTRRSRRSSRSRAGRPAIR